MKRVERQKKMPVFMGSNAPAWHQGLRPDQIRVREEEMSAKLKVDEAKKAEAVLTSIERPFEHRRLDMDDTMSFSQDGPSSAETPEAMKRCRQCYCGLGVTEKVVMTDEGRYCRRCAKKFLLEALKWLYS